MTRTSAKTLRIAVVAGEESGDILGADLVDALQKQSGKVVDLIGVGGSRLQARGLNTLFDPDIIAIMGLSAVVRDLPRLLHNLNKTAKAIVEAKPDCLITIDSPAFNMRVAKKVRAHDPAIPIIKYVCPSVWAWGEGRAVRMRPFTDHVLCLLPFEPEELQRLKGPKGTFVGHRLSHDKELSRAASRQKRRKHKVSDGRKTLLVLPGSRRSEVSALADPFRETITLLQQRGQDFRILMPTVPRVQALVRSATANWPVQPEILVGDEAKWQAFGAADAALAASGTVTLELALAGVPTVVAYKADRLWRMLGAIIRVWSASLPNLIADRVVMPEYFNEFVRPGLLARHIEALFNNSHERSAQLAGFAEVSRRMKTKRPAGEIAAAVVLAEIDGRRAG